VRIDRDIFKAQRLEYVDHEVRARPAGVTRFSLARPRILYRPNLLRSGNLITGSECCTTPGSNLQKPSAI
jgi:hypothetical protein